MSGMDLHGDVTLNSTTDWASLPTVLPVLKVHDQMLLPFGVGSVMLSDPADVRILTSTGEHSGLVWMYWSAASDAPSNQPESELPPVGVVCRWLGARQIDNERYRADWEGICRAQLVRLVDAEDPITVEIAPVPPDQGNAGAEDSKIAQCRALFAELTDRSGQFSQEQVRSLDQAKSHLGRFTDLIGNLLTLRLERTWDLARTVDAARRLEMLIECLREELVTVQSGHELESRVRDSISKRQRAEFLRLELAEIRRELESLEPGANELDQLADEIAGAGLPPPLARRARTELDRLRVISTASSEYSEIRNYIDWLIHIPWSARAHERTDTLAIRRILDDHFYGQKRAKERIVEYLTVLHGTGITARNVLCLLGPSGIGKTQLARAIARALRRPLVSLNLGVLRSEAALRGNRRTFPGAMPGRLLRQLRAIEVVNPVCVLEEVDRLGGEIDRPDLTAILLETIDPSANKDFWDYYLGFPCDLSQVLFICTATNPEDIPEMLADRMEIIELPGYLESEKVEVTFKHLWPRLLDSHQLDQEVYGLTVAAVHKIIREYTMEAGLSNLDKSLELICRILAARRASGDRGLTRVGAREVEKLLGTPLYIPEKAETKPEIGVAMGVAWTQTGGDIMLIEALKMRGSGNVISTGSLGEVMRESIQAAHSYVRSRAEWLEIPHADFGNYDIHIHFPSGAIPKDGPSAGITVSLVIASVMSDRPIRNDVALTGEVSLRGKVLPVGGIKEKVAAAHRVGIHKMVVPRENIKDLKDVSRRIAKEMSYIAVDTVDEVFEAALLDFDPSRASLEKLLRLELAKKESQRKPKPKAGSRTKIGRRGARKPS
jgi:ATP-dependent Lon protease